MGVKLIWQVPDSEATYDKVYIYRSTSETGTYTEIANQNISDNTYYDMEGTTSHWYKIRFYDSTNGYWSDYSEPMKGGWWGAYCTIDDVKEIMDVPSTITDISIFKLARIASLHLNQDIQVHVYKEKIEYIDNIKTNKINGTNKVFYTKNWPIGDMDNDFMVDEDDVTVYKVRTVNGEETETEVTVSSVDAENGKITLESAPESDSVLYVTYVYTPRHYPVWPNTHELIRRATAYLTAFLLKNKMQDESLITRYTIDRLTIVRSDEQTKHDYVKYRQLVEYMLGTMEVAERTSD